MAENQEAQSALVLDFGDGVVETFKAKRYANSFLLARHAEDLGGGGYQAIVAATTLALDQVEDDEHVRLERFLFENGRNENYLEAISEGLGNVWSGETKLPFDQPSTSSETISPQDGDTSSTEDSSSPATAGPAAA